MSVQQVSEWELDTESGWLQLAGSFTEFARFYFETELIRSAAIQKLEHDIKYVQQTCRM